MNIPYGGKVNMKMTEDGDNVIDSVTYSNSNGETKTIKFEQTLDGARIPTTGFTIDGDFFFPL